MEHFFSPNSSGHLRSDADQSQIIGGDADVDHTQTIGGIQGTANLLGVYILPSPLLPRVSAPLITLYVLCFICFRFFCFCLFSGVNKQT